MPTITRNLGPVGGLTGVPGSKTLAYETDQVVQYSATQMMMEAQKGAAVAESQLQGDVAQIKSINDARRHFNELVISVASYASGKTAGDDPKGWRKVAAGEDAEKKYRREPKAQPPKPTLTALVPLAYQPQFAQLGFMVKVVEDS
jgi:hypothetical protein